MKPVYLLASLAVILSACSSAAPSGAAVSRASPRTSAAASGAGTAMTVSYSQASVTQGAMFTGIEQGFFARNGLTVSAKQMAGTAQIAALIANEVQIAGVGASEVAMADIGGAHLSVIATAVNLPFFSLYADSKYRTIEALTGQSVGITTAGSSTDSAARLFLQRFGMLDKVRITPAGNTQAAILAAVMNGAIAAGIFVPPVTEQAAKAGLVELVNGIKLGIPMNTAGIATTRANVQDRHDMVLRFLRGYQQAWTFNSDPANEAAVVKVLTKYTQASEADSRVGYMEMLKVWQSTKVPTMNPEALGNILKLSDNPQAKAANPNDFIDSSLLLSIQ